MPGQDFRVGDRVVVYLASKFWLDTGWFPGTVVRIDPYSAHRSFFWVELDRPVQTTQGGSTDVVSVFNPKHIKKEA
jgi:hypothetical protein